jgi:excinuclease ABC subunit A
LTLDWEGCKRIENCNTISRVLEVDQSPIGKTSRSTPATYIGLWDKIRNVFSQCSEAKMRGWSNSHFSFNSGEGRCPTCKGNGVQKIEMNFLPNVLVKCEECSGKRFTNETTKILWKNKSISDILEMNVENSAYFFSAHHSIFKPLDLLKDLGLGYLTLGQPSSTLSGGEAQRIKLASELSKSNDYTHTLYVLDEPTVGLHMADIEKLIKALNKLVSLGNTVVVVEHQLDIWAASDWIIDLGPTGGKLGGELMNQAPPHVIRKTKTSTGTELNKFLRANQKK